jgi:hypothetical protein
MNSEVMSKGDIGISAIKDDDWISGLEYLYKSPGKNKQMGLNGRQVINNNYSIDIVAKSLVQVFQNF